MLNGGRIFPTTPRVGKAFAKIDRRGRRRSILSFCEAIYRQSARAGILVLLVLAVPLTLPAGVAAAYEVEIVGVDDAALQDRLLAASYLNERREEPPASVPALIRRAEQERERLDAVLRSEGYYAGAVVVQADGIEVGRGQAGNLAANPETLVVGVATGPLYRIVSVVTDGMPATVAESFAMPLEVGAPARAADILNAETEVEQAMNDAGYAFATMGKRTVVVDHATTDVTVRYVAEPGQRIRFGDLQVKGRRAVDASLLRGRATWEHGDYYSPAKLAAYRRDLQALDVFDSIKVNLDPPEGEGEEEPEATADVLLTVSETPRRFVGFGGDFSTGEGFGVNAFWGHRNLFGGAERLKISGRLSRIAAEGSAGLDDMDYLLESLLTKPDFLMPKQQLEIRASTLLEHPDAFTRRATEAQVAVARPLGRYWNGRLGTSLEYSQLEDENETNDFLLLGLPATLRFDNTDSLLDPSRGLRSSLTGTPYLVLAGADDHFARLTWRNSSYLKLANEPSMILAGRATVGVLVGADRAAVPADKRLFAGGGGSIRGYGFQEVGPKDSGGTPIGGRSLVEAGLELRMRFGDYGIVPFVDAGNVYNNQFPDLDGGLKWAAGVGIRYYTDFGPLRLDVGLPLNPEDDDEPFAVYVSIGQAF
ncbi:autotransporter assembly complex protein TamA [Oceanibacterium hippocampi]|uniref:Translocation and assembly module TamA n=1 Tax=Oceanibacterium hippocampi TaxID=745714 RepID=A0A1Y5SSP4_9PROT|nr:BamA/TamA family outer membrane protein [Oceanibacterium hippocampi]SLN45584.1 Translocation and assembly module TamA precursor [Oceanibacterium hippocampi]